MSSTIPQPPSCGKTSVTAILIVVLRGEGGTGAHWRVTVGNLHVTWSLPGRDDHEAHQEPANTTCERGVSQTERGQSHLPPLYSEYVVVDVVVDVVVVDVVVEDRGELGNIMREP